MFKTSVLAKSTLLALALVLVAGSVSEAQQGGRRFGGFGGRGFGGGGSKAALLRSEQVQKELSLTEDQISKVNAILSESRESSRELFSGFRGLRDLPEAERAAKLAEAREKMQAATTELNNKIGEVIDETQNKRLDQIVLQQRGTSALTDKEVAAKLSITDDQQQKIKDLVDSGREMQRELFQNLGDIPREERRAKFEELGKKREEIQSETDKAVLEVLTASQKTQLEELQGAKFELDRSQFRGRGRGGEGRRSRRPQNEN